MPQNKGPRYISDTDINILSTTASDSLGAQVQTGGGFHYTYVQFGGTSTVPAGSLVVAPAVPANTTGLALDASNVTTLTSPGANSVALNSTQVAVTNGATAVTQDEFAGGKMSVLGTNGGFQVSIMGNTATAASGVITLYLSEGLLSALVVGTNTVNLEPSPYMNVVTSTTASMPIGVTNIAVPNTSSQSYYGWVQTSGLALVAIAATTAKGVSVVQSTATAGDIIAQSSNTALPLGVTKEAITGAGFISTFLTLL